VALALAPVLSRRQVELETSGPDHLILWADPDRLEQVLINLAKNAAEASGPGGRVRLLWERRGTATGACAGVLFRVSDEGPGMVPEQCTRAFEPFYSTKGGGSGLGLSLSHAIVEQHGGRLLLESAPGRGTTALLELPPGGSERMGDDARVHSDR